jgi:hypothetical protein
LRDQHARSAFAGIPFSDDKFDRAFAQVLAGPHHVLGLVAEGDGHIVGALWASSGEYFIGEGARLATIHMIAVETREPPIRRARIFMRLVAGVRIWAEKNNTAHVLAHVTTGTDSAAAGRLLRAIGGNALGGSFLLSCWPDSGPFSLQSWRDHEKSFLTLTEYGRRCKPILIDLKALAANDNRASIICVKVAWSQILGSCKQAETMRDENFFGIFRASGRVKERKPPKKWLLTDTRRVIGEAMTERSARNLRRLHIAGAGALGVVYALAQTDIYSRIYNWIGKGFEYTFLNFYPIGHIRQQMLEHLDGELFAVFFIFTSANIAICVSALIFSYIFYQVKSSFFVGKYIYWPMIIYCFIFIIAVFAVITFANGAGYNSARFPKYPMLGNGSIFLSATQHFSWL